ncbi:MAG: 3-phosphoserine/phosphohydroxythreonine transaminase [Calditrichia bacterium]
MEYRVFNFSAGPATLPLSVLETAQKELINFHGEGMSILEMSHRSKTFDNVINDAVAAVKNVMGYGDNYSVLFLQGGATGQFAAVPMNLAVKGKPALYINTGSWSKKAISEAKKLGIEYKVAASSEEEKFGYIPAKFDLDSNASYVHITSNNTIFGTQWQKYPDTGKIPLVADMSSDFYCRRFDPNQFGFIYAGAQKNAGPAGVTIVIIRNDLLERSHDDIPTILNYKIFAEKNSLYNTPNCFGIYIVGLVMHWILDQGGIDKVEAKNRKKAELLYDRLDNSDFYRPTAREDSRSLMNVTFRLPSEDLEKKFVAEATENGMIGLKGHRSVGGIRASIYNAMPTEGVETLVSFMKEFEKKNG